MPENRESEQDYQCAPAHPQATPLANARSFNLEKPPERPDTELPDDRTIAIVSDLPSESDQPSQARESAEDDPLDGSRYARHVAVLTFPE